MRVLPRAQQSDIHDVFRSKIAMVIPVLEATLYSLNRSPIDRLGGLQNVTLHDLAREFRQGNGDAGICNRAGTV